MPVSSATPTARPRRSMAHAPATEPTVLAVDLSFTDKPVGPARTLLSSKCPFLPYSLHSLLTFIGIETIVIIGIALYIIQIHPTRPYLAPLAVLLPTAITVALHNTITSNTLPRYDKLLRTYLRNHARLAVLNNDAGTEHDRVDNPSENGYVVTDRQNENAVQQRNLLPHENGAMKGYSNCEKCGRPRLNRIHHCRKCARCIPRMSHHCGVLGVCIGGHNLKPFLLLCLYGSIATGLVAALTIRTAVREVVLLVRWKRRFSFMLLCHLESVHLMFVVSASLALVFTYHITLILRNFTVLEAVANRSVWSLGLPCFRQHTVSPFHTGSLVSNLKQVFGVGWFALVPVADISNAVSAIIAGDNHAPCEIPL